MKNASFLLLLFYCLDFSNFFYRVAPCTACFTELNSRVFLARKKKYKSVFWSSQYFFCVCFVLYNSFACIMMTLFFRCCIYDDIYLVIVRYQTKKKSIRCSNFFSSVGRHKKKIERENVKNVDRLSVLVCQRDFFLKKKK